MNLKALEKAWLQETVGSQSPGTPNTKILVLGGWQKGYPILNGWAILTFASEENWERLPKSNSAKRVSLLKPKNNSSTSSITQNHPQICSEGQRNGKIQKPCNHSLTTPLYFFPTLKVSVCCTGILWKKILSEKNGILSSERSWDSGWQSEDVQATTGP